jgi:TetR/AcrR family transcriptional repressor of lmrAB and yxaGH operons
VLELTGAPRGSIYHHFPDGKDQLVAAAVDLAGARAIEYMEAARGSSAIEVTKRFLHVWRELLTRSDFTVTHAAVVFRNWRSHLAELLQLGGLSRREAQSFAVLLIAATEGAVVLARAEQSIEPFTLVARSLTQYVTDAFSGPASLGRQTPA